MKNGHGKLNSRRGFLATVASALSGVVSTLLFPQIARAGSCCCIVGSQVECGPSPSAQCGVIDGYCDEYQCVNLYNDPVDPQHLPCCDPEEFTGFYVCTFCHGGSYPCSGSY